MARHTIMIEVIRHVIRIGDRLEITLMARITSGGSISVPGTVTGEALQPGMTAGQRELRQVMVKCRRRPRCRAVTVRTKLVKVICDMIRIYHSREIAGMATITRLARSDIRLGMTGNTLQ